MTRFVRWFIKKFLPGYHLAKDPVRKKKTERDLHIEDKP